MISSVEEIIVLDAMAKFYSYAEKQRLQAVNPKMPSTQGKYCMTNSDVKVSHSFSANELTNSVLIPDFNFYAENCCKTLWNGCKPIEAEHID